MSAKLMDATPDLKRLAPVENLAIDVISYAHGSVTPTLTHLYSKGKDSFLKVRRRQRRDTKKCTGVPFSFLSFSLSLSCFCRTHERYARRVRVNLRTVGRLNCTQCDDLCASINGLFKSFSRRLEFWLISFLLGFCNKRPTHIFFFFFFEKNEASSSKSSKSSKSYKGVLFLRCCRLVRRRVHFKKN